MANANPPLAAVMRIHGEQGTATRATTSLPSKVAWGCDLLFQKVRSVKHLDVANQVISVFVVKENFYARCTINEPDESGLPREIVA